MGLEEEEEEERDDDRHRSSNDHDCLNVQRTLIRLRVQMGTIFSRIEWRMSESFRYSSFRLRAQNSPSSSLLPALRNH